MGKVVALIPARGGSKGIPNKNIKILAGYPVIAYSIASALLTNKIERVFVSTDSSEIANVAKHFGAEVPFLRPANLATDQANDFDYIKHFMDWCLELKEQSEVPEYIVLLRPTTPLREPHLIEKAIEKIRNFQMATSLRSAHEASESPYKWFRMSEDQVFFKGLIDGYSNEEINMPRQMFPKAYVPNGYVDIIKTKTVLEEKVLLGEKMIAFETPLAYELDTVEEFAHLDYLLQESENGVTLKKYLKNTKGG